MPKILGVPNSEKLTSIAQIVENYGGTEFV
jgi:hypothetical protein